MAERVNVMTVIENTKHSLHILHRATGNRANRNGHKDHNGCTYSYYLVSNMNTAILLYGAVFCYTLNKNTRGLWAVRTRKKHHTDKEQRHDS